MTNARDPRPLACRPADLGPESDFGRLVGALCNGTLTRPDRDRLEKLLADTAVRAAYRKHMRLHAGLVRLWHQGACSGGEDVSGGSTARPAGTRKIGKVLGRSRHSGGQAAAFSAVVIELLWRLVVGLSRPFPVAMLVAGGVVAGVLGIAASMKVPPPAVSSDSTALVSAARITGLHEAKWGSPEGSHGLSDFLFAGTTLAIESGLVELRYDCGAMVIVEGPAVLHVDGRSTARLDRGRLTARLEKAGASAAGHRAGEDLPRLFTVHTPRASVHDLGTEFGVEVREAGDADIQVFDGLVELARADRGLATASGGADLRLAAGDSAQVDESGRITATGGAGVKKFVRTLPKAKPGVVKPFLEQIGWNDATAEVIYRDSFAGEGQLAGSTPASRGGVGQNGWIAPPKGWELVQSPRVLVANTRSSAYLPLIPESGHLYRIAIAINVTDKLDVPTDWFALGFSASAKPLKLFDSIPAYAWMAQRFHTNELGNFVVMGKSIQAGSITVDRATGPQRRSIILDTSRPQWTAYFLRNDTLVGRHTYPQPLTAIQYVALCNIAVSHVRDFVVERNRP